jgi:hypothetical protein
VCLSRGKILAECTATDEERRSGAKGKEAGRIESLSDLIIIAGRSQGLRVHKGVSPRRGRLCARVSTEVVAEIVAVEEGGKEERKGRRNEREGREKGREGRKEETDSITRTHR